MYLFRNHKKKFGINSGNALIPFPVAIFNCNSPFSKDTFE